MTLPDYVLHNREHWDKQAAGYVAAGERHWAQAEPTWASGASPNQNSACSRPISPASP